MPEMLEQARAMANQAQGQGKGLGQGMSLNQLMMQQLQQQGGAFGQRGQGAGGKAFDEYEGAVHGLTLRSAPRGAGRAGCLEDEFDLAADAKAEEIAAAQGEEKNG